MAKAKPAKNAKAKSAKSSSIAWPLRFSFFLLLCCALVFASAAMVFFVCMIPTLVAMLVDRQPQKTLWMTVGSLNLAGTVPAWFALWDAGRNIGAAIDIISNPGILIVAYGGAAAGWIIHMNVTPLVAAIVVRRNESRLKDIDKRQRELARKWGDDIGKTL